MINSFWFNGRNSFSFGIGIIDKVEYPVIQEEIELIPVEGRKKGSLTRKTGNYKDLQFDLNLKIFDIKRYKDRQREVNLWLNDIKDNRLFFDDYREKCYKVKNVICDKISDEKQANAILKVTFNCEPFLYKTEEYWQTIITNNYDIFYIGDLEGSPNLKLTLPSSTQNISLIINGEEIQLKSVSDFIYIDSELIEILDNNNQSISNKMIGNFPTLRNGYNKISWIGNIEKIEILNNTIFVG